jgi:electron transfer flavoprotein alpha subunit
MTRNYKPPKDAAEVFAQYKAHYEGERELKPAMVEFADRELKAGATVGQLAKLTGLTPEVFRRRARALGIELKRPPTVGKLKPEAPDTPAPAVVELRPAVAAPPTRDEMPATRESAIEEVELPDEEVKRLNALGRLKATSEQQERLRRAVTTAKSLDRDPDIAQLEALFEMGLLAEADVQR